MYPLLSIDILSTGNLFKAGEHGRFAICRVHIAVFGILQKNNYGILGFYKQCMGFGDFTINLGGFWILQQHMRDFEILKNPVLTYLPLKYLL